MTKEILEQLTGMGISEEELKDPKKVEELAKTIEAENKAETEESDDKKEEVGTKVEEGKETEIHNNQLERLAKAIFKRNNNKPDIKEDSVQVTELDIDNRVFIKTKSLSEDEVSLLKENLLLPSNKGKSFEDIYSNVGVQAQIKEIKEQQDAVNELDTNSDDNKMFETQKEINERYNETGKEPETDFEKKAVIESSLKEEGFQEF
jgi:hypothetical protein